MMATAVFQQVAPLVHPSADFFLVGFGAALSVVAGVFFLRFWRETRDLLFLGFAIFFLLEAAGDSYEMTLSHPNVGNSGVFLIRFVSRIAVLAAILWKNRASA